MKWNFVTVYFFLRLLAILVKFLRVKLNRTNHQGLQPFKINPMLEFQQVYHSLQVIVCGLYEFIQSFLYFNFLYLRGVSLIIAFLPWWILLWSTFTQLEALIIKKYTPEPLELSFPSFHQFRLLSLKALVIMLGFYFVYLKSFRFFMFSQFFLIQMNSQMIHSPFSLKISYKYIGYFFIFAE